MKLNDLQAWEIEGAGTAIPDMDALVNEARRGAGVRSGASPRLAVRLLELVVHNNQKWFGEATIRVDTLVLHGRSQANNMADLYAPRTFRFERVGDDDSLPIGSAGLLLYFGKPRHFLDLFITVSRDREGSANLSSLLEALSESQEGISASGQLLAMATGAPDAGLLGEALRAALLIGDMALLRLQKETSGTIGLYRNSWLRGRDRWGIGLHPEEGLLRSKDLSFRFEILQES